MKNFEYRGKSCHEENEWVYGYFCGCPLCVKSCNEPFNVNAIGIINSIDGEYGNVAVLEGTVFSYTGKYDLNNVKIFEGDIVKCGHFHADVWIESLGVIEWDDEYAMFNIRLLGVNEGLEQMLDVPCEVVGNIVDNKDLIGR